MEDILISQKMEDINNVGLVRNGFMIIPDEARQR
jgi:hypothetical protein